MEFGGADRSDGRLLRLLRRSLSRPPGHRVLRSVRRALEEGRRRDKVANLGFNLGGKKTPMRSTTLLDGCIGPEEAKLWKLPDGSWEEYRPGREPSQAGAVLHDAKLKVGDNQHCVASEDGPPPFYALNKPRFDRPMTSAERKHAIAKQSEVRLFEKPGSRMKLEAKWVAKLQQNHRFRL